MYIYIIYYMVPSLVWIFLFGAQLQDELGRFVGVQASRTVLTQLIYLIWSHFPGENPFLMETELWVWKNPDGRAKLGQLTSLFARGAKTCFLKLELGMLAFNGDVGTNPANSYLVDPASSHMLVSKIKPCTCK